MTIANREIAKIYANGKIKKGKSKHIFIDNDTIYSYGYHFPIAKRINKNECFFNSNDYSHTTGVHKNNVRQALWNKGVTVWEVPECDILKLPEYIINEIEQLHHLILQARTKLPYYIKRLAYYENHWNKFKERFNIEDNQKIKNLLEFKDREDIKLKIFISNFEKKGG